MLDALPEADRTRALDGLALLAELRPAFIKVDMSIVRGGDQHPNKQRLVALLLTFANATGARLVAEGVETQAGWDLVASLNGDGVQGYLVARPLPAAALPVWLDTIRSFWDWASGSCKARGMACNCTAVGVV